jgi:hypothetical protein
MTDDQWYGLVDAKDNDPSLTPATAPARPHPVWEKFWTIPYSVVGAFKPPEIRDKMRWEGAAGGGANPLTVYMVTYLSRKYGPVYVLRGKLPSFPNTYKALPTMPKEQVVYWSVVSVGAGPSGELWDGLYDMQLPLDQNGNYTIVMSLPEDRPKNATREKWGRVDELGPRRRIERPARPHRLGHADHAVYRQRPELGKQPGENRQTRRRGGGNGPLLSARRIHRQDQLETAQR